MRLSAGEGVTDSGRTKRTLRSILGGEEEGEMLVKHGT